MLGTLYVPKSFLDEQSPGKRQYWVFKSDHFDKILLFKLGKFYELFNMDAVIGVEKCGLKWTNKDPNDVAHSGFPEMALARYSETIIGLGYQCVRIEQTETKQANEERVKRDKPGKFEKVLRREVCDITSGNN